MTVKDVEAKKEYLALIKKVKSENREKGNGIYYEAHHILPKSIYPLWKNRKSNIVLFKSEEHFKAHQLLAKMFDNKEMWCALHLMSNANGLKINDIEYKTIKEHWINIKRKYDDPKKADAIYWSSKKGRETQKRYHSKDEWKIKHKVNVWANNHNYPDPSIAKFPKGWNDDDKQEYIKQFNNNR